MQLNEIKRMQKLAGILNENFDYEMDAYRKDPKFYMDLKAALQNLKESKLHENEEPGLNDVLTKEELINRLNNVFNDESINSLSFFQKVALTALKKQIISKINASKIQTRADLKAALQNP